MFKDEFLNQQITHFFTENVLDEYRLLKMNLTTWVGDLLNCRKILTFVFEFNFVEILRLLNGLGSINIPLSS